MASPSPGRARHALSVITLAGGLVTASTAYPQQLPSVKWIEVGRAGSVLMEYTRSALQRSGDGVVVAFSRSTLVEGVEEARRQRIDALRAGGLSASGYERYLRQVRRAEFDCVNARVRTLAVTDYDASGTVLAWASAEGREGEWSTVPAGAIGRKLLNAVCAAAPL